MQRAEASTVELNDESPGTVEVKAEDEAEVDDRDDGTDLELFIATWYITSAWDKRPFLRSNFAYHSAKGFCNGTRFVDRQHTIHWHRRLKFENKEAIRTT